MGARTIVWLHFNFFFLRYFFCFTPILYPPSMYTFRRFFFPIFLFSTHSLVSAFDKLHTFQPIYRRITNLLFYSYLTCHTLIVKVKCRAVLFSFWFILRFDFLSLSLFSIMCLCFCCFFSLYRLLD